MHFTRPQSTVGSESNYRSLVDRLIPAKSNIFLEIYHEIIAKVILDPSAGQFWAKVCARCTGQGMLGELTISTSPKLFTGT